MAKSDLIGADFSMQIVLSGEFAAVLTPARAYPNASLLWRPHKQFTVYGVFYTSLTTVLITNKDNQKKL